MGMNIVKAGSEPTQLPAGTQAFQNNNSVNMLYSFDDTNAFFEASRGEVIIPPQGTSAIYVKFQNTQAYYNSKETELEVICYSR